MTDPVEREFDRLRWQCRRGLLELDCVFEDFLEQRYRDADTQTQAQFRALLNELDPDLQAWILHGEPVPEPFVPIVRLLRGD